MEHNRIFRVSVGMTYILQLKHSEDMPRVLKALDAFHGIHDLKHDEDEIMFKVHIIPSGTDRDYARFVEFEALIDRMFNSLGIEVTEREGVQ